MSRFLIILSMIFIISNPISNQLWAQIGHSAAPVLAALAEFELKETSTHIYTTPQRDRIHVNYEYGIFTSLAGKVTLLDKGIDFAATAITYATSYDDDAFFSALQNLFKGEDIQELVGKGEQSLELGRNYILTLGVRQGFEGEYIVNFLLEPSIPLVVDAELFPPAMHSLGPADAHYIIREFSDFQCPYCTQFALNGLPVIKDTLLARGDVRFEFHHFPLNSIHPNAAPASEASLCVVAANSPDDFWAYHDALFERQNAWSGLGDPYPYFVRLARDLKLEHDSIATCLQEGHFSDDIQAAYQHALSLGARGTPTLFVNNIRMQNDYSDVDAYLELFALIDAHDGDVQNSDVQNSDVQNSDADN